jgi:hypothetical protein
MRALALLLASAALPALGTDDKKVQVYILMGQSNCVGLGTVTGDQDGTLEYAVKTKGLYPYLLDSSKAWAVRDDVRNVFIMGSGNSSFGKSSLSHNEQMTVKGKTMGVEYGIGNYLGNFSDSPVMILKSCIGNRALGWDLLPPGSKGFEYTDSKGTVWEYAGYHDSPARWEKGTTPKPIGWAAGIQYDGDTDRAKVILDNISKYYPGATSYEVAGFFWWQGDRDSRDMALAERYEQNLVKLIKVLREEFKAPKAKFVTATLGQTVNGSTGGDGKILDAMFAVDGTSGKYAEFKDNVAAVYTHPLSKGGASGGHYNHNAETYMNVGEAMGDAMIGLLKAGAATAVTV